MYPNLSSSSDFNEFLAMNTNLVDSIVQLVRSLSKEERDLLEEKLFFDYSETTAQDLIEVAQSIGSFDFLENEPDLYTLEDGEAVL